ncbi:cytochrome c3 family protein [Neobacillus rhizosphaerae]|uniref:cytochrome c3 family protein n=1 Tax=Neobacillus rhizosphaerae TaxID=2880965 RepID=UPI003D2B953F
MSKLRISLSALFMLVILSMFGAIASAEGTAAPFTPTSTNPAPGIHSADVDNFGNKATHRTHGNFQNNTNACANCHSTHNGEDSMLLMKSGEYELCMSCHDGTMGFYNVKDGSGAGTFNESHESASMHNVDSGLQIGSAPGAVVNISTEILECSSCHNPHGSANDRLLNETVLGKAYAYNVSGKMGSSHGPSFTKTTAIPTGQLAIKLILKEDPAFAELNSQTGTGFKVYKSMGPDGARDRMNYSNFCSVCHDDYLASRSAGKPSKTGYSHTTNNHKGGRNCASCHYAHGTDITTLTDSSGRTIADLQKSTENGGLGFSETQAKDYMKNISPKGSALKKFTNMSVCFSCHAGEGESLGGPDAAGKNTAGTPDTPLYMYTAPDGSQPGWDGVTNWRTSTYDPAFSAELQEIIEHYDSKYGN